MPSSAPRKPSAPVPGDAPIWASAHGDSDSAEVGSSPWWSLALAAALAVVAMAATASLLA